MGHWVMPAGTYSGQTKDAIGFSFLCTGLVRDDLSNDVVYNICCALYSEKNIMEGIHAGWKGLDLVSFAHHRSPMIQTHPGAEEYWADRGITYKYEGS